jgi:hypothetical protein
MVSRLRVLLVMSFLLALLLAAIPAGAQAGPNLLNNPGFEGQYTPYRYPDGRTIGEFHIAAGWNPWFNEALRRPEYKPSSYSYNYSAAQQFFTSYSTHEAGLWQRIESATPGKTYRFSLAVYVWSSSEGDIWHSVLPGAVSVRVGIDPTGGINPYAPGVVWSPFSMFYDEWRVLAVDAVARSNAMTVFLWSQQLYPVQHNDVAVDEAYLGLAGPGTAAPAADTSTDSAQPAEQPPAAAPAASQAQVGEPTDILFTTYDYLNLREQPYGTILDVIPYKARVPVFGRSADERWVLVEYEGQRGWVAAWLGSFTRSPENLPVIQ